MGLTFVDAEEHADAVARAVVVVQPDLVQVPNNIKNIIIIYIYII